MAIHPTSMVDPGAELAGDVEIGPWCTVGPGVTLAAGVRLVSHVAIPRDTSVGANTVIHPFAVIGGDPQHGGYKGERVTLTPLDDALEDAARAVAAGRARGGRQERLIGRRA